MAVTEQLPEVAYVANGVTSTFPFDFKIPTVDDLLVAWDGVTRDDGFSVSGLGTSAGNVIFAPAPEAGIAVTIQRSTRLQRQTDYQQEGDFLSPVVNADFDRAIFALQEIAAESARGVRAAVGETGITLPSGASIPNRVLGTDAAGVLGFQLPGEGTQLAIDLLSALPNAGSTLVTYKSSSFGALARPIFDRLSDEYLITDFLTANQKADIREGQGTLDTTSGFALLMSAMPNTGGRAYLDQGAYLLNGNVTITNKPIALIGDGIDATRILQGAAGAHGINFVCTATGNNIAGGGISHGISLTVKDLAIHRRGTSGGSAIRAVWNAGTNDRPYLIIENVCIDGDDSRAIAFAKGLDITNTNGARITNFVCHGNRIGFDNAQTAPFLMTHGIHFQGDNSAGKIDHFLTRLVIGNANTALQTDSWHEGMYIDGFELTYVTDAFVFNGYAGAGNPTLLIQNGHVNVRRSAIAARHIKNLWLANVDLYKDGGAAGAGVPSQIVSLDDCDDFQFNGGKVQNVQSALTDGLSVPTTAERGRVSGVAFRGCSGTALAVNTGNRWSVEGNTFTENGVGVFLAGTGSRVSSANVFTSNTSNVVDNGTNFVEKRIYAASVVASLVGGAASEIVNIAIPVGNFNAKPSTVQLEEQDTVEDLLGYYQWTTGSTATNVRLLLRRRDGGNINAGPHRFSLVAHE